MFFYLTSLFPLHHSTPVLSLQYWRVELLEQITSVVIQYNKWTAGSAHSDLSSHLPGVQTRWSHWSSSATLSLWWHHRHCGSNSWPHPLHTCSQREVNYSVSSAYFGLNIDYWLSISILILSSSAGFSAAFFSKYRNACVSIFRYWLSVNQNESHLWMMSHRRSPSSR